MLKKLSKNKVIDLLIVFFCLAGAGISGIAFWREYNLTLVKLNEEPVATIVFKKRSAQRKFVERNVWDRLKQTSPVYNGDTIRTIEQAEAVIIFQDEITYLSMDESTIIQVFYNDRGGAKIDFAGGNLEVVSESENLEISSGTSTMLISGQVRMNKDEEDFILSVSNGTASFDGIDIEAGGILALDSTGTLSTKPVIAMTSFGPSAYVLGSSNRAETVPVVFAWNTLNFTSDTFVLVQIAEDRRFNSIIETRDVRGVSSVSIPLQNGNYWWRSYPVSESSQELASGFYPSGTLEVIPFTPITIVSPSIGEEFVFAKEPVIPLSWTAVENVSAYLLEISTDADMSNLVITRRLTRNSIDLTGLDFGRWYLRITPEFPLRIKGASVPSQVAEFSVRQDIPVLAAPVLTIPTQNGKTYLGALGNYLMWAHDPNAASWLVELADNPNITNPAISNTVAKNHFSIPRELFHEGATWYWRVTAMAPIEDSSQGDASTAVSEVWNFTVTSGDPPVARPVLTTETYIPLSEPIVFGTRIEDWDDLDAETTASNERILLQIVQTLNVNIGYKVRVEGHANPTVDPNDIAGRHNEYIQELQPISEIRARAVMNQLVMLGIDPNRLEYRGFGGEHPLAAWEDTENWWKNRRVEFVLVR